ncbi:hypothetical protein [Aestuariivivens sediminicola]|uniref:hypothetical protein n=1 Tax=Aestuariivivens sediminicola TaxID=2913560 RepID=UPI001F568F81|nr:hypothetical protein [Aestuariivivens sediminicola]
MMLTKQYQDYFKAQSDYELVNNFNRETSHGGWVSQRAIYLRSLFDEFKRRKIDIQAIEGEEHGLVTHSLKHPVYLVKEDGVKKLVTITQNWRFKH